MKYNKQEIMKRAWELKKTTDNTFSVCLKRSWAEAKRTEEKSEKALLIERLDFLADYANKLENGYQYNAYISDWENYGKSRTYFAIYEKCDNSRHNKKKSYGYFDNQSGAYVPEKYGDLRKNYDVRGAVICNM